LPDTTFRVELDTGQIIFAYLSGRLRKNHIKVLVEDRVLVELSIYDLAKGRIIKRL
jgi:translation initiation factor IF-1